MPKGINQKVGISPDEEVAEMFNDTVEEEEVTEDVWPLGETSEAGEVEESDETKSGETEETGVEEETSTETETDESTVTEESTDAETDTVEETGETEEVDQNAALIQQLNDLAVGKLQAEEQLAKAIKPPALDELFKDFDVDEVMATSDNFKDFLTKFATSVQQQAITGVLQSIPEIMTTHMTRQQALGKIRDDFYAKNKELAPVKQFVAHATTQVASEHPDWTITQVLDEAAKRAYKTLGIKKTVVEKTSKKKTPAFVSSPTSVRKPAPKVSPLQKELDDLFDL